MSLYERSAIIPGRVMTRSKACFGMWASEAYGCHLLGDDCREYIDMLCGLGAVSLGYGNGNQIQQCASLPWESEVYAAEAVLKHVAPWASHVRFTVTGSEATHAAYRIAKRATGRNQILIGNWAYHGWHEWCADGVVPLGSERSHVADPCVMSFNHGEQMWAPRPDGLAAVFIEPHRWEPIDPIWLQSVRAFCDRIGALLVYDSMIWGGRMALGGLSEYCGVLPDIECFGKAIGNGAPVACIAGRDAVAKHGDLVSGTYSGHPMGMEAVIDTLAMYTSRPVIATLWERGRQLQNGLRAIVPADLGAVEGLPVHQRIRFANEAHGDQFSKAMLERGVLWHPGCTNVMYAHTEAHIDQVLAAAKESLACLT